MKLIINGEVTLICKDIQEVTRYMKMIDANSDKVERYEVRV